MTSPSGRPSSGRPGRRSNGRASPGGTDLLPCRSKKAGPHHHPYSRRQLLLTGHIRRRSNAGRDMRLLTVYDCIANDHDLRLVALAAAVCAVSSFAATNFLQNMQSSNAKRRALSLPFSALSTGLGIWATHFIAMLAFSIRIPNGYDISLTLFSLLAAITFTYAGFIVALRWRKLDWAGGAIVGC